MELVNVYKLRRLLEIAPPTADPTAPATDKVLPLARYLRPPQQYALKLVSNPKQENSKGDDR